MSRKPLDTRITGSDPYTEVADIVEAWCRKHYYGDALVTMMIDGRTITEFLSFDGNRCQFIWDMDWWEGETDIVLLGFRMIDDLLFYGFPDNDEKEDK